MAAVKSVAAIENTAAAQAVQPVSQAEALIRMIQEAAANPEIDLNRMERLFEMRERIVAKEAETAFFASMAAAQADMPQVIRDKKNDQTKSLYARYESISNAIQPVIAKHGFALTFSEEPSEQQGCLRVVCEVMHTGGHSKKYTADVPFDGVGMKGNANKTRTHAYGSTKSYGRRYLKCDIFDVAVKDQDLDGNSVQSLLEKISPVQLQELQELIDAASADTEWICNHHKVDALPDMNTKQFHEAVLGLKQRIAHAKKQQEARHA